MQISIQSDISMFRFSNEPDWFWCPISSADVCTRLNEDSRLTLLLLNEGMYVRVVCSMEESFCFLRMLMKSVTQSNEIQPDVCLRWKTALACGNEVSQNVNVIWLSDVNPTLHLPAPANIEDAALHWNHPGPHPSYFMNHMLVKLLHHWAQFQRDGWWLRISSLLLDTQH